MSNHVNQRASRAVTALGLVLMLAIVPMAMAASSANPLKKGLKVFVIPKNLGNPYFTTADSVKSGGALFALKKLGEKGTETSGTAATAASQIPAIQSAITKGANALIVSATDASALCPTLKSAMKKKITVVTYDSDAPACRTLFINQANSEAIGRSEVSLLAKQIGKSGEIAIVSAAASATNQNAWIGFMKKELKKYPNMKLVSTVYGNDDPTVSTQVTQGVCSSSTRTSRASSRRRQWESPRQQPCSTTRSTVARSSSPVSARRTRCGSTSRTARSRRSSFGTRLTSATSPHTRP
jgi:rhamnose transport system substrate-binding protein